MHRIGFMQGRLSPLVDQRVQAFPALHWRDEFPLAERFGFPLMEWTLDHEGLSANPLMSQEGQAEIRALSDKHGVEIRSLTGDCFMQAPFFKATGSRAAALGDQLHQVIKAAAALGVRYVVMP